MHEQAVTDTRMEDAKRFLSEMFSPYKEGYIELRCLRGTGDRKKVEKAWFPVTAPERAAEAALKFSDSGLDVYFGVLPRDSTANGKKANVSQAAVAWLDVDFKNTPREDAEARLANDAPDLVVHSGGGLHCYWKFTQVFPLDGDKAVRRFEASLEKRIASIGGDPSAKDASRVLRVPGTLNYKYSPPRVVGILPTIRAERPALPPLTPAQEQSYWELELAVSETKCAEDYSRMMVWYWGAMAAKNRKTAKQWEAKMRQWRFDQAAKRDGFRVKCPFLEAEVIVVERIPYIPPGEPVIFERAELELLQGQGEEAVRAAWQSKREFGGKWTGPSLPPAENAYFAEVRDAR